MANKCDWTLEKAKAWVKEHEGKTFEPHEVSQSEIIDEIDYLKCLIDKAGMSNGVVDSLSDLLVIEEKVGAVLNRKNKDRLNQIRTLAQEILDSAGEEDEKRELGNDMSIDENQAIILEIQNVSL